MNILVAHLFAFGAETSGSERAIHVSHPFAVKPGQLPQDAQYIALGHIHRPQEVGSASRCFYSGSPLQLDFGEREQQKRVVIVDVRAGFPANIESVNLTAGRRLREVTTTMDQLPSVASECGTDLLRVIVKSETKISGLSQQVSEVLPNVLEVRQEVRRRTTTFTPAASKHNQAGRSIRPLCQREEKHNCINFHVEEVRGIVQRGQVCGRLG